MRRARPSRKLAAQANPEPGSDRDLTRLTQQIVGRRKQNRER
jgi:hypothetical protein